MEQEGECIWLGRRGMQLATMQMQGNRVASRVTAVAFSIATTCDGEWYCFLLSVAGLSLVSTNTTYDILYYSTTVQVCIGGLVILVKCQFRYRRSSSCVIQGCCRWSVFDTSNWWASSFQSPLEGGERSRVVSTYVSCKWELWLWWVGDGRIQAFSISVQPRTSLFCLWGQNMMALFTPLQK